MEIIIKQMKKKVYDLYFPYPATKRKDKHNKILLFVHGGGWIGGNKEQNDIFCRTYSSQGFITATIGYTLLMEIMKNIIFLE